MLTQLNELLSMMKLVEVPKKVIDGIDNIWQTG